MVIALLSCQRLGPSRVKASGSRIAERAYLTTNTTYIELRRLGSDGLVSVVSKGISGVAPSVYDVTGLMTLLADTWRGLRQELAAQATESTLDDGGAEEESTPMTDEAAEPGRHPAPSALAIVPGMTEEEALRRLGGAA